jgi:predicted ester cyclase
MSTKENKELIRQEIKGLNEIKGDVSKVRNFIEKYCTPDFIYHAPSDMNREQFIQMNVMMLSAFPDFYYSLDDMVAEGDKIVNRYTVKGTHKGTFMGIPATGKHIVVKGVEIHRISGGGIFGNMGFS